MISRFLLFTLTLLLNINLTAQDVPQEVLQDKIYKKQFGFDANVLLNRFINFSGNNSSASPYQVIYRKYGATSNKRYGLGFGIGLEAGNLEPTALISVSFRFGKERFKQFGKVLPDNPEIRRWRAFYGLDWKTQLTVQHIGAADATNFTAAIGPSPLFGLLFQINERISISTEMAYDFDLTYSRFVSRNVIRFSADFVPPVAIYLGYDF